jgi:hypothetical protein
MTLKLLPLEVVLLAPLTLNVRMPRFDHSLYSIRAQLAFPILAPTAYLSDMWVSIYEPRRKLRPS